jgi:phosphoglycolate phosphatase
MADFGLSEREAERAVFIFREYFSVYGWWDNRIYEGVVELLEHIKSEGYKIALATSKPEVFAVKILKRFDIFDYFDYIGAATLDHKRDKKSEVLEYLIKEIGLSENQRQELLLVGDTVYDFEGAKFSGVDFLGVLYGYGKEADFPEGTSLVADVQQIAKYL